MQSIADIRRALGLTQAELGQELGLNQSTISRFENGTLPVDSRTSLALEALQLRRSAETPQVAA